MLWWNSTADTVIVLHAEYQNSIRSLCLSACLNSLSQLDIIMESCSAHTDIPGTDRTCMDMQRFLPAISCEPDGSYSPKQCQIGRGQLCVCVDTETGATLAQYPPFPPSGDVDCVQSKSYGWYNLYTHILIESLSHLAAIFRFSRKSLPWARLWQHVSV